MARDSHPVAPWRVRGKRPADSIDSVESPAKRRKKAGVTTDSRTVLPNTVASHDTFPRVSSIASSQQKVVAVSSQVPIAYTSTTSVAEVLPTLPDAKTRQQTHQNMEKERNKDVFNSSDKPKSNNSRTSSKQDICKEAKNASKMTANQATVDKYHASTIPSHRSRITDLSTLCRRIIKLGILASFLFDIYRSSLPLQQSPSSLDKSSTLWSNNMTTAPTLHVTPDNDIIRTVPRKANTVFSHHLLQLQDYERQQSLLYKTEKQLALVRAALADSQHDAVTARRQVTQVQDAYASVTSKLEQSQQQVIDTQRRLELAFHELERAQWDLTRSHLDLESLSEQLSEAYQLLKLQETVAVHTLNFVATTAVKQRQPHKLAENDENAVMSSN